MVGVAVGVGVAVAVAVGVVVAVVVGVVVAVGVAVAVAVVVAMSTFNDELQRALARFGADVFAAARDELGDLDGAELQELMQKHGLLHEVRVFGPCVLPDDEFTECRCCEYGDFPQDCLRPVDGLPDLVRTLIKPPGFDPDDAPIG